MSETRTTRYINDLIAAVNEKINPADGNNGELRATNDPRGSHDPRDARAYAMLVKANPARLSSRAVRSLRDYHRGPRNL